MMLPTAAGGSTTEQVGYFDASVTDLAHWIARDFGTTYPADLASLDEAVSLLAPYGTDVTRYLCVPVGSWTALLTNGPLGTDPGVLPSCAARELGCRALRVVNVDDSAAYPARVLEVYGPEGEPPLAMERSIVAANDGGRWVFEVYGTPYSFEDEAAYSRRTKASRFTSEMVYEYLRAIGVPMDEDVNWAGAMLVERSHELA